MQDTKVMDNMYTLEDIKTANMVVRMEYDSTLKDLQKQINDLKALVNNLSSKVNEPSYAIRSISQTTKPDGDKPQFKQLTHEQLQGLKVMYDSPETSDWDKNFINTVMTYQRVSEKQWNILQQIAQKVGK